MSETAPDLTALLRDAPAPRPRAAAENPGPAPPAAPPSGAAAVPPPRSRWRTRVALPAFLFAATGGLLAWSAGAALWPATTVGVAPIIAKAGEVAAAEGAVIVQAPGWVEADPFPTAVSALADGVVAQVAVLEGDRVEAGQVVARLIDADARIALQHAEAMFRQRQAELESARAALAEAEQNWEHPIELIRRLQTSKAQLAEQRAALERWPAELEEAEAHAVYLQADYSRLEPLREQGQASEIELVRARQAHLAQQAAVEALRRRKPMLEAQIAALQAEVQAAEDELRLRIRDTRQLANARAVLAQTEGALAAAEAARAEAALRLERMTVRSPAAGVVMTRLVEPGSKVMLNMDNPRSAQIVRLYDPQRLQVRVDIPLVEAAKVGVGQPAEVIVDVLPERVFGGRVTRIVHEADVQKNTLQVKVAIEAPSPEIKPEMLARARFLAAPSTQPAVSTGLHRLFAPASAVHEEEDDAWVWLADQTANVARRREVTLGRTRAEDHVEITSGLQLGDRVIVQSDGALTDGARISIDREEQP